MSPTISVFVNKVPFHSSSIRLIIFKILLLYPKSILKGISLFHNCWIYEINIPVYLYDVL